MIIPLGYYYFDNINESNDDEKKYSDSIKYGFNITTNSPNVKYLVKFPIPSNWELENDIIETEGNPEIRRTREDVEITKRLSGTTIETVDYIAINGSGSTKMVFGLEREKISGINFPEQDYINLTIAIFAVRIFIIKMKQ
jgi:hypothetical protein